MIRFLKAHKGFFMLWTATAIGLGMLYAIGRNAMPTLGDMGLIFLIAVFPVTMFRFVTGSQKESAQIAKTHLRRQSLATRAFTVIWDGTHKHPLLAKAGERTEALVRLLFTPEMVTLDAIKDTPYWSTQFANHHRTRLDAHVYLLETLRPAGFHNPDHVWFDINALATALCADEPDFSHIVNLIDDIDSFFARIAPAPETTAQ